MEYKKFVELYIAIGNTTKKLEKVEILSEFFKSYKGKSEWLFMLKGKVLADYDSREIGISDQLILKALCISYGLNIKDVQEKYNKIGDWGEIAEFYASKRRQNVLFSKKLEVDKVYKNLLHMTDIEGHGAISRKMQLIAELLSSASAKEAKYIIRTLLEDLRIGVQDATLIDALNKAFYAGEMKHLLEEKYDMCNDFAQLYDAAKDSLIEKIDLHPGKPVKVMLAVKAEDFEDAFRICGKPAAIEHKYDGFRMLINSDNGKISLFTRRLENVTKQFPDVVSAIEKHVKGKSFILDSEVVGFNPESKKYLPFESISQRIKRKYDISDLVKKLPVEVNVFDCIYHNGKNLMSLPFSDRRKKVESIIKEKELVIRPATQIITSELEKAKKFYKSALAIGEEGIMVKALDKPYKQGRKIGYMVKLKPIVQDLDLVITGAEYGTGKRAGWLTSFIVAVRDGEHVLDIGMVSSGLKEKEEEGVTYNEMTKLLKPLIISEEGNSVRVKPKIVVSVTYQNIQRSPSYSSGYALRFPRITHYRPDRRVDDIASVEEIEREVKKQR